jgi:energy-coupling factor transporter ATP-binding protein EcfA2
MAKGRRATAEPVPKGGTGAESGRVPDAPARGGAETGGPAGELAAAVAVSPAAADERRPSAAGPGGTGRAGRAGRLGDAAATPAGVTADDAEAGAASAAPGEPYVRVDAQRLESALLAVRQPVVSVPLLLNTPGIAGARAERRKLLSQIDDYLLPRLRQSGAPILVALVGSTGAGKSTLLNSIVGAEVSLTGIRRPTTNSPVLACHPSEEQWFAENVFLPTLPRVRQQGLAMPGRDGLLVLAANEGMPRGVALLDTPDIDSLVQAHREFAHQFLDASDLWLFMTSARRYADAAVWELLQEAKSRAASLAIVLSRVPPGPAPQITGHFDAMLAANGLADIRRFVIPETIVKDSRLPLEVSGPVREWLAETAQRDERRVAVLTQTMSGVLDTFPTRVIGLAGQVDAQLTLREQLAGQIRDCYAAGRTELDETVQSGTLLQGEVLARWQDFAGTGDLLRALGAGRRRGRGSRAKTQRQPDRASAVKAALRASLESLIAAIADRCAESAVARWQQHPGGSQLLADLDAAAAGRSAGSDYVSAALADLGIADAVADAAATPLDVTSLGRASPSLATRAPRAISAWQDHVQQLVQAENVTKRSVARVVSLDAESLALMLMIGMLVSGVRPDADGEDIGAVLQRLLTSLFGAGLLRDLEGRVRLDLGQRAGLLFEDEARRFTEVLDAAGVPDEAVATQLCQASYALETAR